MNDITKKYEYMDECFYGEIKDILVQARRKVYQAANTSMVNAYWNIGKRIVEKQGGSERSEYGSKLIKELSKQMSEDFGKGYTQTNLKYMRQFYLTFPKGHALRDQLTWTHYRLILRVKDETARNFYMDECAKANWSTRQLERQINSFFYERLRSSKDKTGVANEIYKKDPKGHSVDDIIRDPYVLEFLNLKQDSSFYESQIEQGLLTHLQTFLLELGNGFSFVARQKRISFDGKHFFIDLVFYNYLLKCFVLIDLKTGELTHQDLGQMQMYINYYTREMMNEGDQPPIGIVLCASKNDAVVKYTLPQDNTQIYASKYQLYLPSVEELEKEVNAQLRVLEGNVKYS